ncbi:Hypp5879 [Branchiostoma lanceolatum]|uniref:Hypp5879 protein n=1 Tax=Branchiostoma lanceolatum TaxID=7740 RepID=A0A8J9VKR6_BRALA|nr:Hypp5879 [Branchiostoma lanceolatum]
MTGCDSKPRGGTHSDESVPVNPNDDSTEDVQFWHEAEESTPSREGSLTVLSRTHSGQHRVRTKIARQTLCHSWPQQQHIREDDIEIERRNTIYNSPASENIELSNIDLTDIKANRNHLQGGKVTVEATCQKQPIQTCIHVDSPCVSVIKNDPATCKLRRTDAAVQRENHTGNEGSEPGTTTDTDHPTDPDPSHESLEEYRAYVREVRSAGRQNFAKQTEDLVRRTLQVGNWTDITRQVPLTEAQASQVLSETTDTAKEEAMAIYDKHIQDKGSPQRLYKLQEALVKRAVLSLGKRCKGMCNCA